MLQDIAPHIYHNPYLPVPPRDDSPLLCYGHNTILCHLENGQLTYPTFGQLRASCPAPRYLFAIDDIAYFLGEDDAALPGFAMEPTAIFRTSAPREMAFAGVTGLQLHQWYGDSRFCGHCGGETVPDSKERMLYCPRCHNMIYPRISPAVIVAICDGDRLLLTRYANRPFKKYALIAGFAEIGESIEDTVHREVHEEVGLAVRDLTFYKSQPWSLSGSLLLGFFARLDGSDHITLQEDELAEGCWIQRGDLDQADENFSLTNEMIRLFAAGNDPFS
ncbi:MAG: NAD(+) diphosphatase [Oscillospiraceae bacterium]